MRRLYFIVRVFLSYGLDELIPTMRLTLPLRFGRRLLFWIIDINPREKVGNLSVSQMQMIEIAKAFSYDAKIVIMDEPTSS
ncbi:ATP-binding cassette domain-containing protein, partial [Serratia sp. ME43]|uniref:ATP-binding cassette domain-containing protein n=1 Tax=Serratia sp. ME43 TaxID=2744256 RepID=UPI0021066EBF